MSQDLNLKDAVEAIRKRAEKLAEMKDDPQALDEAEALAALVDGTVSFDAIDEAVLERCVEKFGIEGVVEAVLEGSRAMDRQALSDEGEIHTKVATPVTTTRVQTSQTAHRSFWQRSPVWISLAASIVLVVGLFAHFHGAAPKPGNPYQLALQWPTSPPFNPASFKHWGSAPPSLAPGPPDFDLGVTLGAGQEDPYRNWRLATVIVRSSTGYGSGTFISKTGWILTNYHVVADAAQEASLEGRVVKMQIITGHVVDDQIKPNAPVEATLFRVDIVHDLALLKLDSMSAGVSEVPYFNLAKAVDFNNAGCFVIGSQFGGPAWWVRPGKLTQQFDYPEDLSQNAAGVDTAQTSVDRTRSSVFVSNTSVSPGDSGGPLLNNAGELIGLTFATSANDSGGSVGWHIALGQLRAFTATLPDRTQMVPFDLWTAGLPEANMLDPQLGEVDHDGPVGTLIYRYSSSQEGADTTHDQPTAIAVYVDLHPQGAAEHSQTDPMDRVPYGIWGTEDRGRFRFDICVVQRADRKIIVAYTNDANIVDEIRISNTSGDRADTVWIRAADGSWSVVADKRGEPLLDAQRISQEDAQRLGATLGASESRRGNDQPQDHSEGDSGQDHGGPNKIEAQP